MHARTLVGRALDRAYRSHAASLAFCGAFGVCGLLTLATAFIVGTLVLTGTVISLAPLRVSGGIGLNGWSASTGAETVLQVWHAALARFLAPFLASFCDEGGVCAMRKARQQW